MERRWPRIEVALKVYLRALDLIQLAHLYTTNISRQGVFIACDSPRPIGTHVTLVIEIETRASIQAVDGVVVHVSTSEKSPGMGVFIPAPPPEWQQLCEALERARKRREDDTQPIRPLVIERVRRAGS
jgi:hypothetical protein